MGNNSFIGEILHTNGVRMRVIGSGNLQLFLQSLDEINVVQITSIPMTPTTNKEPTILTNFIDQRVRLKGTTTFINETFNISRIILFVKPIASEYPR